MKRRRVKNKVLKTITAIVGVLWLFSACSLDSISNIPIIVNLLCTGWIFLIFLANKED